jgi:hypothetical protein
VVPIPNMASPHNASKKSNVGPIVGGVIGGVIGLGLLVFLAIFFWRRTREEPGETSEKTVNAPNDLIPHAFPYEGPREQLTEGLGAGPIFDDRPPRASDSLSPPRSYSIAKGRQAVSPIASDQALLTSSTTTYTNTSSDPANSSRDSPSLHGGITANAISPAEVRGLREEVENLRRVMQTFQHDSFESPPEYVGS